MDPTLLLALSGTCALNCLVALHLAGPLPVTQQTIVNLTGFGDSPVRVGLTRLLTLGLVTCNGQQHHTAWQLAPRAGQLALPLTPLLPILQNARSEAPQEEEDCIKERVESLTTDSSYAVEQFSDAGEVCEAVADDIPGVGPLQAGGSSRATEGRAKSLRIRARSDSCDRGARQPGVGVHTARSAPGNAPKRPNSHTPTHDPLRAHFYAAFEAAGVYLQFRRRLADALLAEDGAAWLCQALGWICYAERSLTHVRRGAVVYIALRDRLPCDAAYLPPPDLPFEAALTWAMRGGADEAAAEAADETADDPDNSQSLRVSPTVSPEDKLWREVLERLGHELPRGIVEDRLRETRLVALDQGRCLVGAPTPQARDWLANRMTGVLARALREVTGRVLAIEVVVERADGTRA